MKRRRINSTAVWLCVFAAIMLTLLQLTAAADGIGDIPEAVPQSEPTAVCLGMPERAPDEAGEALSAADPTSSGEDIPEATPADAEDPTATPSGSEIPTATPSGSEIPEATPFGSEIPAATPSGSELPEATQVGEAIVSAEPSGSDLPEASVAVPGENSAAPAAEATPAPVAEPTENALPVSEEELRAETASALDMEAEKELTPEIRYEDRQLTNESAEDLIINVTEGIRISISSEGLLQIISNERTAVVKGVQTIVRNVTTYLKTAELKKVQLVSTNGHIELDSGAEGTTLDLGNADVSLSGTSVILKAVRQTTLKVKSLLAEAKKEYDGEGEGVLDTIDDVMDATADMIDTKDIRIEIENVDIEAAEDVTLRVYQRVRQSGSQTEEEAANGHSADEKWRRRSATPGASC